MRQTTGVAQVKSKLKDMMDEEKRLKKASQSNQPEVLAQLSEHQKKAISERDRYLDKMKQQLLIINSGTFSEAKIMLEELIKSQKSKLEKFENRFTEILQIYKNAFNDQTKELILSHGDKIINVKSNPFA